MKKSLKLKLGMSVASLALLAGALSTTTYAWFTANATATTEKVTATAKSSGVDLYLSNDGITFSASVTPELKWGVDDSDYNTQQLDAVAGNFTEAFAFEVKNMKNDADAKQYVYFDLYFKTTATTATNVIFNTKSGTTSSITAKDVNPFTLLGNTKKDASTELTAGNQVTASIVNAARFGIQTFAPVAATANGSAPTFAAANGATKYIATDNTAGTTNFGSLEDNTIGAGLYYSNVMGASELPEHTKLTKAADEYTTATLVTNLEAGQVGKIRMYIWLEGWDEDCFDAVLGQSMEMIFSFTTQAYADTQTGE